MTALDCSSLRTALGSIADIMGCPEAELRQRLLDERMDEHFDEQLRVMPYDDLVWAAITGKLGRAISPPSEVIWFHATRVRRDTPFSTKGLLPLKDCIRELRAEVERIAAELNIPSEGGSSSTSYCCKVSNLEKEGPCAFLLRDAALGLSESHRNYLKSPEIEWLDG